MPINQPTQHGSPASKCSSQPHQARDEEFLVVTFQATYCTRNSDTARLQTFDWLMLTSRFLRAAKKWTRRAAIESRSVTARSANLSIVAASHASIAYWSSREQLATWSTGSDDSALEADLCTRVLQYRVSYCMYCSYSSTVPLISS
jgi:hypothetical protein